MASLAERSLVRLSGTMPDFPGATYADKLAAGRAQAEQALRKYVPDFKFDLAAAEAAMADIDAWAERNGEQLGDAIDPTVNTGDDLPENMRLQMGAKRAQSFIVASFTLAAAGIGPWRSGRIAAIAGGGGTQIADTYVGQDWAIDDAEMRLQTFGLIVGLEQRGQLGPIFAPATAMGALAVGTIILITIVVAIVAAAIVLFVLYDRQMARNNELMRDICLEAQKQGDERTVAECVKATQDLQTTPLSSFAAEAGKVLAAGLLLYAAVRFVVLPALEKKQQQRRLG